MPISETSVRSRLHAKGYKLAKWRTRNENHPSFGCFAVLDPFTGFAEVGLGPFGYELSLEEAADMSRRIERNDRLG